MLTSEKSWIIKETGVIEGTGLDLDGGTVLIDGTGIITAGWPEW